MLARWCQANNLPAQAAKEFRKVIMIDPTHEEARKGAGYEQVEGRRMSHDEVQRAKGLVPFQGRWMTLQERDFHLALEERRALERRTDLEIRQLLSQLASEDADLSCQAADRLAAFAPQPKVAPFVSALDSPSSSARLYVADELGEMKEALGENAWNS